MVNHAKLNMKMLILCASHVGAYPASGKKFIHADFDEIHMTCPFYIFFLNIFVYLVNG